LLTALYEAWNKPEKAEKWQAKLQHEAEKWQAKLQHAETFQE